jgi:hypothetical protein
MRNGREPDPLLIEAVAERVLELMDERERGKVLLTVAEVAARYRVHRSWVYANANRLGAIRLGEGAKAPLRFDPETVTAALRDHTPTPAPAPDRRGEPSSSPNARRARGLLPVYEG